MNQFGTILSFELKGYFKNKVFCGITIFLVAVIAIIMFFPRVWGLIKSDSTDESSSFSDRPVMFVLPDTDENSELLLETFAAAFEGYDVQIAMDGLESVKSAISAGEAECAFVLDSLSSFTYYVENLSMYDQNAYIADEVLATVYRMRAMIENGISVDDAVDIMSAQITHKTENLGIDQMQNFFYTYIMIFALYMVILLYGQMVATNVATEKSSRAMELLITSAKPTSMMFGKVIASCLAGLIQLIAVFGSSFLFFNLNKNYWGGNEVITSIFDMPLSLFIYMLVFFVLGFFIYAFLFGAVGSTASKLEDINTSVMPIILLFVAGFLVVMFSMSSGSVDNMLVKVCSFIPFTSPMAMFTRIAMSTVPIYEILISIAILILSTIGIGVISAKIYRVGVLLYGTTPKIGAVIKAVIKA